MIKTINMYIYIYLFAYGWFIVALLTLPKTACSSSYHVQVYARKGIIIHQAPAFFLGCPKRPVFGNHCLVVNPTITLWLCQNSY